MGRPTQIRWLVFALACATSWLLYLHRYAWGVVRPEIKAQFPELTDVQLGWLDAFFNATYAVGQVPGGLLGDLCGPRAILALLIFLWSGCLAGLALAPGFWWLASLRAAFGLSQAGAYPILSQVTRRWFPLDVRTTVQGAIRSLSGRAGGACAPLLVATLLMGVAGLSWRTALLLIALPGAALALAFWLLFRDRPRQHPWTNEAERQLLPEDAPTAPGSPAPRLQLRGPAARTLVMLLVYASASTFADQLYVFWLPQFLIEAKGLKSVEMGLFAGLPLVGGALGGLAGGALNDVLIRWTGNRRLGRAAVAFTGKLLAAVLIFASLAVADGRLVMLVLLACKFFGDWSLPTQWGAITDIGGRAAGTVFGLINTAGSIAAFAAGPLMGYLKQYHGWEGLFACVAAVYLFAALCWLLIDSNVHLWSGEPAST